MRKAYLLFLLIGLVSLAGCNSFHHISLTGSDLYKKKRIRHQIESYDVIVHSGEESLILTDADLTDSLLTGKVKEIHVGLEAPDSLLKVKDIPKDQRNDLHVYLSEGNEITVDSTMQTVVLNEKQVKNVRMIARKQQGVIGFFATLLLFLLGSIVAILLIILLAVASSDSDGSGGSDSGGSDSGGESSCYIATMSYGSYDAPQVLILRKFRDRFLQKYGWGRAFIRWYYAHSPAFVEKHRNRTWLHRTLRAGLDVLVAILSPFYSR